MDTGASPFYDLGRRLAFVYQHGGLGYVTMPKPDRVILGAGYKVYFLVAQMACTRRELYVVTGSRVSLPGTSSPMTVALSRPGVYQLHYCQSSPGDLPAESGNRVALSPIGALRTSLAPPR